MHHPKKHACYKHIISYLKQAGFVYENEMHAFIVTSFVARVLHFSAFIIIIIMHYHFFLHAPIFSSFHFNNSFKSEIHLIIIMSIVINF